MSSSESSNESSESSNESCESNWKDSYKKRDNYSHTTWANNEYSEPEYDTSTYITAESIVEKAAEKVADTIANSLLRCVVDIVEPSFLIEANEYDIGNMKENMDKKDFFIDLCNQVDITTEDKFPPEIVQEFGASENITIYNWEDNAFVHNIHEMTRTCGKFFIDYLFLDDFTSKRRFEAKVLVSIKDVVFEWFASGREGTDKKYCICIDYKVQSNWKDFDEFPNV